jgi:hypothetical protein
MDCYKVLSPSLEALFAIRILLACTLSAYSQQGSNGLETRVYDILSKMTFDEKLSYIGAGLTHPGS